MKTITKTTLEVGDLVHHNGKIWIAERFDTSRPCEVQCSMHDGYGCHGYCWRWDNGDGFVFRFILPDVVVKDATEIVATPDLIAERLARAEGTSQEKAKAKYYAKVKAQRAQREKRAYGTGNVYPHYNGWRCEIFFDGNKMRKYFADKDEALAWLDEMVKKKKAMEELDKLKGTKKK